MKKILTVGILSFLGGGFLTFLIVYLVLIPAGIFPFGSPTTSPGGYPLPGNLCVYNTSTSTVEVWLNGVQELSVAPAGEINFASTGNIPPGEYKLSLKAENDYKFIDMGSIEVKVDRETWIVIKPDLSTKIKYTLWLPMNEFPPRAFLESDL
ncbi:MAG: hypothetical protein NUV70_08915 [Caldiserica bacterium]|jgi:hypothetical protein|nr:hypothetical protein [Caldisericota bacterium]